MATSKRFQARNGLDNNSLTLIGVATPVNTTDAANKAYADTKLALTGGTLSGNLTIDGTAAAANTATVLTLRNTLDGGIGMNFTNSVSVPLASINALVTSSGAGTDDGILQFNTAVNGVNTERVRITAAGDVGIGTSSPAAKLDVVGSLGIRVNEDAAGTKVIQIRSNFAGIGPSIQVSTADPLLFLTSNTERMRITSTGDVGIGTSSPSYKLDIRGSAVGSNFAAISVDNTAAGSGSPANTVSINFSNGGAVKDSITGAVYGDGYLAFATNNNTEKMRIDSAGNVGIGTVAPSVKLQVNGTSNGATLELLRLSNIGTGANTKSRLNFYAASGNYGSITGGYGASSPEMVFDINTTAGAYIWNNNATEQMRINASGNLGLGVTPSAWDSIFRAVQVGSANYFSFASQNSASSRGSILWNAYGTGDETFAYNKTGDNATRFSQQYDFRWYLAPSGTAGSTISFTEAMRITSAGDVGIGTSSPSAKLDVAGTVRTTGQLTSTVATGTAPFVIASTTRVANLNVATAGTADALTTARNINEVSFNGSADITVPRVRAIDDRTAAPADFTTRYATVGFGSWNNNNTSPYADYIALRTYGDATGGNDNMVSFRKDAIGMRVWQQTYGSASAFATFKDVAFTDSNITGSAASLTTTRTLWGQNFNGTANVTGSLTSVGDITGTGAVTLSSTNAQLSLQAPGASGTVVVGANSNNAIFVNSAGKVGIGGANLGGNPLEVAGNLLAYASVPGGVIISGVWNSSSTANSNAAFSLYNDLPVGNFAGLQYFTSTNDSELRVSNKGTNTAGTVAGEITFHNGIGANYVRRARINSTGEFVLHRVNTTSAGGMLRFQDISGSELYFIDVFGATASTSVMRSVKISTGDWQWISNGLALRMSLTDSGALGVNATPSTTAGTIRASSLTGTGNRTVYSDANGTLTNTSSDATLKNNVQDIQYGLSSVLAMRPVSFNWIDEERFGSQTEIGFIAQEIQQIVPEVIGENSDQTLSLDYPKLIAVLTKAIQDQQAIIADITQRLTVLEGNT